MSDKDKRRARLIVNADGQNCRIDIHSPSDKGKDVELFLSRGSQITSERVGSIKIDNNGFGQYVFPFPTDTTVNGITMKCSAGFIGDYLPERKKVTAKDFYFPIPKNGESIGYIQESVEISAAQEISVVDANNGQEHGNGTIVRIDTNSRLDLIIKVPEGLGSIKVKSIPAGTEFPVIF